MNGKSKTKFLFAILLPLTLIFTSLACSLPQVVFGSRAVEVSEEAAASFEENLQDTAEEFKDTGQLEITISESELTSYIATQLNQSPNPAFTNPQIFLRDGQIQLTGNVDQGTITLPLKAALTVQADGFGGVDYEVVSASIGPLKLPAEMLNLVADQVQKSVGSNIALQIPNIYVEEITVSDGNLVIKGHSR